MNATVDELAGVVDLFGGLTRDELENALSEVAFRDGGQGLDEEAFDEISAAALESFALVSYERADDTLLVAGPTAFPAVPEHAEDLPHICEFDRRTIDRERLGEQARDRFVDALETALDEEDDERVNELIEVSYDLESWAPVDLTDERDRLDARSE